MADETTQGGSEKPVDPPASSPKLDVKPQTIQKTDPKVEVKPQRVWESETRNDGK